MALCQIADMDIIAPACTVAGVVVIAKHIEMRQCAAGDLRDIGHEVVGNVEGIFAD